MTTMSSKDLEDLKILPTGTCFDDALFVWSIFTKNSRAIPSVLVHGICLHKNGDPYAHAWVEKADLCIFSGIMMGEKMAFEVPQPDFYEYFRVTDDVTKYELADFLQFEDLHTRKAGPWEKRYIVLTTDGKESLENEK
jgi:hypothetical protein